MGCLILTGDSIQKEFGDYQTPFVFASEICLFLKQRYALDPSTILEPTCGIGNFLEASTMYYNPKTYYGIDVSEEYIEIASRRMANYNAIFLTSSLFDADLNDILKESDSDLLIIGNPPWVNNSNLSVFGSSNVPKKSNFKKLRGIDALTGESNFDISEFMILSLIDQVKTCKATIALLVKTTVARNVFKELVDTEIPFVSIALYKFDTKKVFDVSVDGCLFVLQFGKDSTLKKSCPVYILHSLGEPEYTMTYSNGRLNSTDQLSHNYDGNCQIEWRQGIKHDCSKVLEFKIVGEDLVNKQGIVVNIEDFYVYPLLKSSDIKQPIITDTKRKVLVTQSKIGEDTSTIQEKAPLTWMYLQDNSTWFDKRKSSIYTNSAPFSIFGVGDYSFSRYKVVISGLYKEPMFALVSTDKPTMVDDTCYLLPFEEYDLAYVAMLLLNHPFVIGFLEGISFKDTMRPYSKKILSRIDFSKITEDLTYEDLCDEEYHLGISHYIDESMYESFKQHICKEQNRTEKKPSKKRKNRMRQTTLFD